MKVVKSVNVLRMLSRYLDYNLFLVTVVKTYRVIHVAVSVINLQLRLNST